MRQLLGASFILLSLTHCGTGRTNKAPDNVQVTPDVAKATPSETFILVFGAELLNLSEDFNRVRAPTDGHVAATEADICFRAGAILERSHRLAIDAENFFKEKSLTVESSTLIAAAVVKIKIGALGHTCDLNTLPLAQQGIKDLQDAFHRYLKSRPRLGLTTSG